MAYIGQAPTKVPLTSADITDGTIALADMAANSVDSDQYVDGSIDAAHLSANSIDSDAYVDGSIDLAHMSSQSVDEDNLHISNSGSNGNFLSKQSGDSGGLTWAAAGGGFTLGTETATTSGTTFNFGSIPTGTKLIIINFNGVSLDGSAALQVQIGDAGGIETSGYVSSSGTLDDDDTITHSSTTASFIIRTLHSYAVVNMRMVLSLTNSSAFTWHSFHGGAANNNESTIGGGTKSLSAELTQIQILDNGSDNFDAGSINISYQ